MLPPNAELLPPIPDFITFLILIILAFILNITTYKNSQKARKYKRELDAIKSKYQLDEPDANLNKIQTSATVNTATNKNSKGDDAS